MVGAMAIGGSATFEFPGAMDMLGTGARNDVTLGPLTTELMRLDVTVGEGRCTYLIGFDSGALLGLGAVPSKLADSSARGVGWLAGGEAAHIWPANGTIDRASNKTLERPREGFLADDMNRTVAAVSSVVATTVGGVIAVSIAVGLPRKLVNRGWCSERGRP